MTSLSTTSSSAGPVRSGRRGSARRTVLAAGILAGGLALTGAASAHHDGVTWADGDRTVSCHTGGPASIDTGASSRLPAAPDHPLCTENDHELSDRSTLPAVAGTQPGAGVASTGLMLLLSLGSLVLGSACLSAGRRV